MDIIGKLIHLENCRIKFSTGEGDYEGTLIRIVPQIQLLVFSRLIWLPKNLKMGTLTFRAKEIEAFSVKGRSEAPKFAVSSKYTNLYERDIERPTIYDDELDISSDNDSERYSVLGSDYREYAFELPPSLSDYLPSDNVIIDALGMDFSDAIKHFRKQDSIGMSLENPKIGRHEDIHWVCVSTGHCTFLFDIKKLGVSAFSDGLQEILESPKIEKIVHDCRQISDCLFHRYNTRLSNVYDTQVADFVINQQLKKDSDIVLDVRTLNQCLADYLNVPKEFLLYRKWHSYQDEVILYDLRPVMDLLRNLFTKNVIYLRLLKVELDILLLRPLTKFVDDYMNCVRSKTDRELELAAPHPWVIPDEILSEDIQVFRFKKHMYIPAVVSSGPPYREVLGSYQDFVNYCRKHRIADLDFKI